MGMRPSALLSCHMQKQCILSAVSDHFLNFPPTRVYFLGIWQKMYSVKTFICVFYSFTIKQY